MPILGYFINNIDIISREFNLKNKKILSNKFLPLSTPIRHELDRLEDIDNIKFKKIGIKKFFSKVFE